MTREPRAALRRSRTRTQVAAALLVLFVLGPSATAFAAPAEGAHCCGSMHGQVDAPPTPCQWIAAAGCCDNAIAVGSAPQPNPPAPLVLVAPSPVWKDLPAVRNTRGAQPAQDRVPRSTVVLLL